MKNLKQLVIFSNVNIREKITGLLLFYFLVALVAIGSTLLVSWRLEGGAAAINDAGRERMRSYRIAYLLAEKDHYPPLASRQDINDEIKLFERTLEELESGNPKRPLFLPKAVDVKVQMMKIRRTWENDIKPRVGNILENSANSERQLAEYRSTLEKFVAEINTLVSMVEHSNARAANLLRYLQISLVCLALIGTVLLVYLFSYMVVRPITRLREGIRRMSDADFSVRLPVDSNDELGELTNGFNRMAGQLQDIYSTLEQRVVEKTRSVEAKNKELAALDREMAVSEERNLLAQELHDSIAQSLAFLNIQVQLLQDDLYNNCTTEALNGLSKIREGVQESYDDVRELLVHFRTRIGSTDLKTAIESALEKFEGQTGIASDFKLYCEAPVLQPEQVLQVMHVVQEALSNVRKHSKANRIELVLHKDGKYMLDIRDNGTGFDVTKDAGETHVGIRIMRERTHRIGAELSFESTLGKGTHICLILPNQLQENCSE
jgi:nitrate/nitrite-specific signal transduction histidine kinase